MLCEVVRKYVLRLMVVYLYVLLLPTLATAAAKENAERPCKYSDLEGGTWKLMNLEEQPPLREVTTLNIFPYQYIAFYTNHEFSLIALEQEAKTPQEVKEMLAVPAKEKYSYNYTLDKEGILNLFENKKPFLSARCVFITKAMYRYIPDDIVLTAYTQKSETQLSRHYRKWFSE